MYVIHVQYTLHHMLQSALLAQPCNIITWAWLLLPEEQLFPFDPFRLLDDLEHLPSSCCTILLVQLTFNRGLITLARRAAVLFWSLSVFLTSRFSSWCCVNTYTPVFLYSGLTFKLLGWLYDPDRVVSTPAPQKHLNHFQKILLPIRLIRVWPVRESAHLSSSFTTHVIQGRPPEPDWIQKSVAEGCIVSHPCTPGGPMSHLCRSAPPI